MDDQHLRYQVVAARRLQWDNLVWQVPVLGLTAQAFLFVTALDGGSRHAKVVASLLSIMTAVLCVTLMARHRQGELADAHWLEAYERDHFGAPVHGPSFKGRRDPHDLHAGLVGRLVPSWPGFITWVVGMILFAAAGVVALGFAIFGATPHG